MVDLQETPAVPPFDSGGDERAGWWVAGGLLLIVGWGGGVLANVLLHLLAPSGGLALGSVRITDHLGSFAWLTLGIGVFTGAIGAGLLWLAYRSAPGPLRLPGYPY